MYVCMYVCMYVRSDDSPARKAGIQGSRSSSGGGGGRDVVDVTLGDIIIGPIAHNNVYACMYVCMYVCMY